MSYTIREVWKSWCEGRRSQQSLLHGSSGETDEEVFGSEMNKSDFLSVPKKPEAVKVRRHERVKSAHLAWIPLAVSQKVMTQ